MFYSCSSFLASVFCCFTFLGCIFIYFCIFTPLSPQSEAMDVKGTAFPLGTVKSPHQGKQSDPNHQMTSVVLIPPHPGCARWLVWSHPHHHFWAGVPRWEPTRLSWKDRDNETLRGQQRHLPLLLVTLQVCMWNSQPQIQSAESEFGQWWHWLANYRHGLWWKSGIFHKICFAGTHGVAI